MTKTKYILCPGKVVSKADGQTHYITAVDLAKLYKVKMAECIVLNSYTKYFPNKNLIKLKPRYDGNYSLPVPKRNTRCVWW